MRVGTRGSRLALTQTGHMVRRLQDHGLDAEATIITTPGDVSQAPVERIGVGVFTQALREAMADDRADIAVHSMKDLPTALDPRFHLVVPQRVDRREALVARDGLTFAELPAGAVVGTSAPRRIAQLRALRDDLTIVPLRGNVDTRIGQVTSGNMDAVILAVAGLQRAGFAEVITEIFDETTLLPAPAQGALAMECRSDDDALVTVLNSMVDPTATITAISERSLLSALAAGCTSPVAATATLSDDGTHVHLRGGVFALDGSQQLTGEASAPIDRPADAGRILAADLLGLGAKALL
ncbi:hydroxymethylbilane synthase [Corynebacterium choanae]|uniref:hydroxymethylbilane synthase n=1 Tax=Corynebacterium choanae TaxID=1862358 RepID=UPI000F4D9B44|nr:hydroxymethylbilane synthase [Corynebacterium choanae]